MDALKRLSVAAETAAAGAGAVANRRTFGPAWWAGDALVAGYSRGKLWRTRLIKTAAGYVAQNQLMACLSALTVDACVSPRGDLVVSTHSGQPDWGSGPNGQGKLYQVRYAAKAAPQPVLAWSASPSEIRIAFDPPLEPTRLKDLSQHSTITQGKYALAGDRFETIRPGYQLVADQLAAARYDVPVLGSSVSADGHILTLTTPPRVAAVNYAVTLPSSIVAISAADMSSDKKILSQHATIDLLTDLTGVAAEWRSKNSGETWQGWLPHLDLAVARAFTAGSSEHARFWQRITVSGQLTLRGQLNLWEMLQPSVQPGSKLDYDRPTENVTVVVSALTPFTVKSLSNQITSASDGSGRNQIQLTQLAQEDRWLPFELSLATRSAEPDLQISWFTGDDSRPRAFPLRRFLLPWAMPRSEPISPAAERPIPELVGGHWLHGKKIFFGDTVACAKCHRIGGDGAQVGPDLSNLIHRDYASVARDIREPSAALNPDHIAYQIELTDGDVLTGILQGDSAKQLTLADATGRPVTVPRSRVKSIRPSPISLMPDGLDKLLNETQWRDLMMFLLTTPLAPAPLEAQGAPPPRRRVDLDQFVSASASPLSSSSAIERPFHIVLCVGPKDHGPGEHDYPLWQKRWSKLLALADNVTVSTAQIWPSSDQMKTADVIAFYSDNPGWKAARAQELDAFLARGGGAVFLHYAVDGHEDAAALAERIGLAWRGGQSKFRHGALDLILHSHPLAAGLGKLNFIDESYWNLVGDEKNVDLVASGTEEGQPRPLIWTRTQGKGRVFVSILGHYTWTFDDPSFRQLILRGICWAGGQPMDALAELATIGARVEP
jgi:putative heme-binding domain-containing protein